VIAIDPRVKVLQLVLVGACIFATRSVAAQAALAVAVAGVAYASGQKGRAVRFLVFVGILTAILATPAANGSGMAAFYVKFVLFFIVKFAPGVLLVMVLSQTEDVTRFIHALERLHVPRVLTLPLAVAMRFVPTLSYELACIKDAMRLRGLQPTVLGFYRRPILTLEYLSVPILMRSLKIADELSASALTRGIDVVGMRTRYAPLAFTFDDAVASIGSVAVVAAIVIVDRWIV
jgi:energy-coupling factor transport system permease protein